MKKIKSLAVLFVALTMAIGGCSLTFYAKQGE